MAMPPKTDLDAVIEAALCDEPMRPVPLALHRRVEERVRIAALYERERTRFRASMAALGVAFLAAVCAAVLVVVFTNLSVFLAHGVPGVRGQYDYYATSVQMTWSAYSGAYSLLLTIVVAGGTLLLGLIPLRRHMSTH